MIYQSSLINRSVRTDKTGTIDSLRSAYVAAMMLEISVSSCNLRLLFKLPYSQVDGVETRLS